MKLNIIVKENGTILVDDVKVNPVKQKNGKYSLPIGRFLGAGFRQWISVDKLQEGLNVLSDDMLTPKTRNSDSNSNVTKSYKMYEFNEVELKEVNELKSKIEELKKEIHTCDNRIREIKEVATIRSEKEEEKKVIEELKAKYSKEEILRLFQ